MGLSLLMGLGPLGCGLTHADLFIPEPVQDGPRRPARDGGKSDSGGPDHPKPVDVDEEDAGVPKPEDPFPVDFDNDASIAVGRPPRQPCALGRYAGDLRCRFDAVNVLSAGITFEIGEADPEDGIAGVTGRLVVLSNGDPVRPLYGTDIKGEYDCESGALTAETGALGNVIVTRLSWVLGADLEGERGRGSDSLMGLIDAPGPAGTGGCTGSWTVEAAPEEMEEEPSDPPSEDSPP